MTNKACPELRIFNLSDDFQLIGLLSDGKVAKWTAAIPYPYSLDDARQWLNHVINSSIVCAYAVYVDDSLIGCVSCNLSTGELGYWIGHNSWSKGYATAALRSLLKKLDGKINKSQLWAACLPENHRSRTVLQKSGLVENGSLFIKSRLRHNYAPLIKYTFPNNC